jgi:hypothetical protein
MSDLNNDEFADFSAPYQVLAEERRAPWWPWALGVAFLALSAVLALVGFGSENGSLVYVGVVGYLLTPLGTAFLLIMAMRSHRQLSATEGYVADSGTRVVKFCAVIAVAGFVLAIPHIWQISDYFALLFAPGT